MLPISSGGAGSGALRPDPHVIVLFGAGGDLAARKLIPGFFHLQAAGLLPHEWRIVGTADQDYDDDSFREHAHDVIEKYGRRGELSKGDFEGFHRRLSYVPVSAGSECAAHEGERGAARRSAPIAGCCTTSRCRRRPLARSPRRSSRSA